MAASDGTSSQPEPVLVVAALGEPDQRSAPLAALEATPDSWPATVITCDVSAVDATLDTIEGLARLQLTARRRGVRLQLCNVDEPLDELIEFVGLWDTLPSCGGTEHCDG
jgi:hypothetical protein